MSQFSIRRLEEKDADRMLEWMRDPDITQFLQIGGKDTSKEQVLDFIRSANEDHENLHMAIVNPDDEYQGTVSLKHIDHEKKEAEYAISMHPSALGTGAAMEGTHLITDYAFKVLNLRRIYLYVQEGNQRAIRFYEKCGLKKTHTSLMIIHNSKKAICWYEVRNSLINEAEGKST